MSLIEQEEAYWLNRCPEQWLLKGDNNTSYFHKIANGRKRKNTVLSFEKDGLIIEGDDNLLQHAIDYYSKLFGPEESHDIHIDPSLWDELPQVSQEENDELCKPFPENEIKSALFQMETNKAAGPNKIPIEFYQTC
jgi:mannosylglycoprotein endo-beta-mannosidase